MSHLPFLFFFLLLSLALGTTGCSRRETAVQQGIRNQVLHRGVGPDVPNLDPHLATGIGEFNILSSLFEGLVSEDPVDLHPVPGVAEGWEISPDGTEYTFHLRSDAKWSNGDSVTANDFVRSFRRALTPSLDADNANLFYVIRNARAFHTGQESDFGAVGIAALAPTRLRITLEHPSATFLSLLTYTSFFPVHLAAIEKAGPGASRDNPWTRHAGTFVGNGPFKLSEIKAGQKIVVAKSATYWDAPRVRLNEIHFHTFENVDAEERAFRAGQLHLTDALPPAKVDVYRRQSSTPLRIDPYLGTEFYRFNVKRPFVNDVRVRRALALAVDRKTIVERILGGGQLPAAAFTPPNTDGYTAPAALGTDLDRARALLAEAGFPGGKGAPPIELAYNNSETHRTIAEAVQEMWRRELGVETKLLAQEHKALMASRRGGDFQLLRSAWIGDYEDPLSFLNIWTSTSGNNYTGWSNPDYDRLLAEAARKGNRTDRDSLLQKAETLLLENVPFIPLYHYTHVFLLHPSVKNWHPTRLDHHPYKYVYLEAN